MQKNKNAFEEFIPNLVFIAICFVLYLVYTMVTPTKSEGNNSDSIKEITGYAQKFEGRLYKSFFSLNNIKPYAIIQNEKTSKIYDNKWISPDKFISLLNNKDKENLLESMADYLSEATTKDRADILNEIKFWCLADMQFAFLKDNFGYSTNDILSSLQNNSNIKDIYSSINKTGPANINGYSAAEKDEAYYKLLNFISNQNQTEQMKLYSMVYSNLPEMGNH